MFPYLYFPNKTWKHFKTYYYEKIILHKYLWFHLYWNKIILNYVTFYPFMNESVVVQLLSPVQLFATPWTAALQAPLSSTISWSLLRFISIELVMLSNHLILCHPFLLPSVFPSITVISSELALCIRWPKYWSFTCYAWCPNPRAGREKASKTMQLAKREVYCWLKSGVLMHPMQWWGVREPQAQAVTQIYRVSISSW